MQAVANGQTITVDAHGVCQKVTNNGGPTAMIPTRSAGEWANFRSNRPGFLALSACAAPCSGTMYAGFCWYLSGDKQSCDTTCSGRGGVNMNGTRNYAGSGGNMSQCMAVMGALGRYYRPDERQTSNYWAYYDASYNVGNAGCVYVSDRSYTPPASDDTLFRYTNTTVSNVGGYSSPYPYIALIACSCNQ